MDRQEGGPGPWDWVLAAGIVLASLFFSGLLAILLVGAFTGLSNRLTTFGLSSQAAYLLVVLLVVIVAAIVVQAARRAARRRPS